MARNFSERLGKTRNLLAGGRRGDVKSPARACATLQALCYFTGAVLLYRRCATLQALCYFTGFSREGRGDRRLSGVFEDAGSVFNTQAGPGPNHTQY
jgi:hypothetical protein